MILFELLSYDADIICLQEVDGGLTYSSFIEPVMNVMEFCNNFAFALKILFHGPTGRIGQMKLTP